MLIIYLSKLDSYYVTCKEWGSAQVYALLYLWEGFNIKQQFMVASYKQLPLYGSSFPLMDQLSLKRLSLKLTILLVLAATNLGSEVKNLEYKTFGKIWKQGCFFYETIQANSQHWNYL